MLAYIPAPWILWVPGNLKKSPQSQSKLPIPGGFPSDPLIGPLGSSRKKVTIGFGGPKM